MKTNANSHFEIGDSHPICQDYALSHAFTDEESGTGGAYAIVCDGCSDSKDVDIGARLLALSAERTLCACGDRMNYNIFGKVTIDNLKKLDTVFCLNNRMLDATLLATWVTGDDIFMTHMYGDGVFIHKTPSTLRVVHVEYDSGAPAYLSYHLCDQRKEKYLEKFDGKKRVNDVSFFRISDTEYDNKSIDVVNTVGPFDPVTITGMVRPGDILMVATDGVNSFKDANGESISWVDMAKEFSDFKSTNGVFVQRRLTAMKRNFLKKGITHYDDISMSAIVV